MADNRIDYDNIISEVKTKTGDHFTNMLEFLNNAENEVASMGWGGSSANFYKETIEEIKTNITSAQTQFNDKLDTDFVNTVNEYQQAEADIQTQTGTIV